MAVANEQQDDVLGNDPEQSGRISQGFGGAEPEGGVKEALGRKGRDALEGAREAAERGKDKLAEEARGVADALHRASDGLRSDDHDELSRYTQGIADKIEQLSESLKSRDLTTMVRDVTRFAERQPALFLGGAFTAGLIAARFFKSTESSTHGAGGGE